MNEILTPFLAPSLCKIDFKSLVHGEVFGEKDIRISILRFDERFTIGLPQRFKIPGWWANLVMDGRRRSVLGLVVFEYMQVTRGRDIDQIRSYIFELERSLDQVSLLGMLYLCPFEIIIFRNFEILSIRYCNLRLNDFFIFCD